MKSPLTVILLTKDNADSIISALDSICQINCEIFIGDLGSKDNTTHLCASKKAQIFRVSLNDDMSQARNNLLQKATTKWVFFMEPWEVLVSGLDELSHLVAGKKNSYQVSVIEGDTVTKSTRLWHKDLGLTFEYPVYSAVLGKAADSNIYLTSLPHKPQADLASLTQKWYERCPLLPQVSYYMACMHLTNKNWDAFLNFADQYLHQEKKRPQSFYMTHYYRAMVYCYIKKDYQKALEAICHCVPYNPTMAEFWCLLADIYYGSGDNKRAYDFYQNGMLLGQRRKKSSDWPMELSKYKEYPEKMMAACLKLSKSIRAYKRQT